MNLTSPTVILVVLALIAGAIGLALSTGHPESGDTGTSAEAAYQAKAIAILQGERVERSYPRIEPGLLAGLSSLSDAMYCAENACTFASEMGYLADVTSETLFMLRDDIISPLCSADDLSPPADLQASHERICSTLEAIFEHLRALEQNVKTAEEMLARNENPSSFQSTLNVLNERMLQNRADVRAELNKLRQIAWLDPLFADESYSILEASSSE